MPGTRIQLHSALYCLRQLENVTLMQTCYVVFIFKKQQQPNNKKPHQHEGTQKYNFTSEYSPRSSPALLSLCAWLFVSLSCIHVSFRSLVAACYVISVCFSRRWQLLQWSKMDCAGKWRQLSVAVLRDVFALLQRWRTTNPWHPPFSLSPSPLPPPISFRHSDCLLRLGFFFSLFRSEWQLMAEIFYLRLHWLFVPILPFYYYSIESYSLQYFNQITQVRS